MLTPRQTIRTIVAEQPQAAAILQRFEIDLCAHADQDLTAACAELQLSVEQVLEKLAQSEAATRDSTQSVPASFPTEQLIRHIVRVHHQSIRQDLPRLATMAQQVAGQHGPQAPEMIHLARVIGNLHGKLLAHIEKEEQVLFPFITRLDQEPIALHASDPGCFKSVTQPITLLLREHENSCAGTAQLRQLAYGYEAPTGACPTHVALYQGLRAFEMGLAEHLHLENEVLFPRAIALEKTAQAGSAS